MGTKRKPFKNRHLSGQYRPNATGVAGWMGYGSHLLDGKPYFIPEWDIPRMMGDPLVQFGLNVLVSPLKKAKWEVTSDSPEVQQFVDATLHKFWGESVPGIAYDSFLWGSAAFLPAFREDGHQWKLSGGRTVYPQDATPHVFTRGELAGQFAGFELVGVNDQDTDGNNVIECPFSFWFAGEAKRDGLMYDHSRLKWAHEPFLEKGNRGGIKDNRRKFHRKWGVPTTVIRHPTGYLDPADPNSEKNKDVAIDIAERIESGAIATMPSLSDEKGNYIWNVEVLDSPKAALDFIAELDYEDKMILLGLGVPREIFEAADTGSGYSGRAIPMEVFLAMSDEVVGLLVKAVDTQIIRHLVDENFGSDAKYDIKVAPLSEAVNPQQAQEQPGGGNMAAALGGAPDAGGQAGGAGSIEQNPSAPAQDGGGGGGDPTAGGMVPYLGKRGGKGKKDPRTGRVYYNLSHDGVRHGCLLAPVRGSLRDAMLAFGRTIPADELADDGLEDDPHLTLRYGLHSSDPKAVLGAVSGLGTLRFRPGPLAVFEGPDHDVLHVSCEDESCPAAWYEAAGRFPHTDTHDAYVPHLTVAYLKKGKGGRYAGTRLDGECAFPHVEYHPSSGDAVAAAVWPSADELADMLAGPTALGWLPQPYTKRDGTPAIKAAGYGEDSGYRYGTTAANLLKAGKDAADTGYEWTDAHHAQAEASHEDDEAQFPADYPSPDFAAEAKAKRAALDAAKKPAPKPMPVPPKANPLPVPPVVPVMPAAPVNTPPVSVQPPTPKPPVAQPVKPIPVAHPVATQPKPPVVAKVVTPPTAGSIEQKDHARHLKWASDKIAGMTSHIDRLVRKHTGKAMTAQQHGLFGMAAQRAMADALKSGKPEVRVPVKVGNRTVYVVVRRKAKTNLSHFATADWDVSVEDWPA